MNQIDWKVDKFNCEKCFCQFVSRYITDYEPRYCPSCYEDCITCLTCQQEFTRDDMVEINHSFLCKGCALSRKKRRRFWRF